MIVFIYILYCYHNLFTIIYSFWNSIFFVLCCPVGKIRNTYYLSLLLLSLFLLFFFFSFIVVFFVFFLLVRVIQFAFDASHNIIKTGIILDAQIIHHIVGALKMGITVTDLVLTITVCGNGLDHMQTLQLVRACVILGLTRVIETFPYVSAPRIVGSWWI